MVSSTWQHVSRPSTEVNLTDTDPTDPSEDLIRPELTDAMDADAFEALTQGTIHSAATIPNHSAGDGTMGVSEGPTTQETGQTLPFDVLDAETSPTVVIDHFPLGSAGAPIPGVPQGPLAYAPNQATAAESAWAPFNSECDWKFARWAKTRGPTSSAVTDLLAIEEVCMISKSIISLLIHLSKVVDKLGLSYRTAKQLNEIIDEKLPGRPPFQCREFIIGDEHLEFYCRDIVECIRSLYGDPKFGQDLTFAPERHYTNPERTCRIYNEMHTGDWWWTVQVCN